MKTRPFVATDWIGALIACPHCGQVLEVTDALGPFIGRDPSENNRTDRWWALTLSDGFQARMWEDHRVVALDVA